MDRRAIQSVRRGLALVAVAACGLLLPVPGWAEGGRLEVVPDAPDLPVVLERNVPVTRSLRVRNAGDADLQVDKIRVSVDSDPGGDTTWGQPEVIGLEGATLPKGATTTIVLKFPAYPHLGKGRGELTVNDAKSAFHRFDMEVREPAAAPVSRKAAGIVAVGLAAVLLLLTLMVRSKTGNGFLQSPDGSYSVSRFQIWFWTEIVLFCYAYLFFVKGGAVDVPDSVWGLLGISVGSIAAAKSIAVRRDAGATSAEAPEQSAAPASEPGASGQSTEPPSPKIGWLQSMLSEKGEPSIMRLQMAIWTVASGLFFLHYVFSRGEMWNVPTNLLIVMGISHTGYLVDKGAAGRSAPSPSADAGASKTGDS